MNINKATPADIRIIQQIAEKSWAETYTGIISAAQISYMLDLMYSEAALRSHFQNPNYHYYLLSEKEREMGFIGFENSALPNTTKLHRIYLLSGAQGKGAGRLAIDFVKEQARQAGDRRIILTVNKNNRARLVYEKLGFSVYGEDVFDIGNGFVMDDFLMELHLK